MHLEELEIDGTEQENYEALSKLELFKELQGSPKEVIRLAAMVTEFESLKKLNDHLTDSSAFEYQPTEQFWPAEVSQVNIDLDDSILFDED